MIKFRIYKQSRNDVMLVASRIGDKVYKEQQVNIYPLLDHEQGIKFRAQKLFGYAEQNQELLLAISELINELSNSFSADLAGWQELKVEGIDLETFTQDFLKSWKIKNLLKILRPQNE